MKTANLADRAPVEGERTMEPPLAPGTEPQSAQRLMFRIDWATIIQLMVAVAAVMGPVLFVILTTNGSTNGSIQAVRVEIQTLRAEVGANVGKVGDAVETLRAEVGADIGKVGDAVETLRAELHAIDKRLVRIETILDPESATAESQ